MISARMSGHPCRMKKQRYVLFVQIQILLYLYSSKKNGIVNTLLEKVLLSKLIKEVKTYCYFDKYLEIFVNSSINILIKRISSK